MRDDPDPALPLAVIVMGVSGSGKTTLGQRLAAALATSYLEGDCFHSAAAVGKMREGIALTDADRWPWLDRLGAAIRGERRVVAACSALRRSYRDRLAAAAGRPLLFLMLAGGEDELVRRLEARRGHYMPASLLGSQLATLEPLAADERGLSLDLTQPADRLCRQALDWLGRVTITEVR